MVWDGYMYHRERSGKKCSWWRCRKNRPQDRNARQCFARGTYKYSDEDFELTVRHTHGPESKYQNYVPPPCGPSSQAWAAAVKGFVLSTDQALLQSKATDVVKHHQCDLCGMNFAIARVLEAHKMLEHQVCAQWKCRECGMQFLQADSHRRHMRLSHPAPDSRHDGATRSPGAGEGGSQPPAHQGPPQQGMNTDDNERKAESPTEETVTEITTNGGDQKKESKSVKIQSETLTRRKERKMHRCEYCPLEFRHPCKLKIHVRQHTGERPYSCTLCPKAFASGSRRGAHFKSAHVKARTHLCDWCGKKFTKLETLNQHVRTHTGEKPFSCSFCRRRFSKRNALKVHLRQHTGERPYVCDQCGQAFTVQVSLRAHLRAKHNVVVKAQGPDRQVPPGDTTIPSLGRPRKSEAEKRLLGNRENGAVGGAGGEKLGGVPGGVGGAGVEKLGGVPGGVGGGGGEKLGGVPASSPGMLACSVFSLSGPQHDGVSTATFCSMPQL